MSYCPFRPTKDRSPAQERRKEERKAGKVSAEEGNGGQEEDAASDRGTDLSFTNQIVNQSTA